MSDRPSDCFASGNWPACGWDELVHRALRDELPLRRDATLYEVRAVLPTDGLATTHAAHIHYRRTMGRSTMIYLQLIKADVKASVLWPRLPVDVRVHARIGAGVNRHTARPQVVIIHGWIDKQRVAEHIMCA